MKAKRALTHASNAANKSMTALGRWAITDRSGITTLLSRDVYYGFWNTLAYIVMALIIHLLSAIGTVLVIWLLIFYGIPLFLFGYIPD
jgi:hypothetical protein